MPTYLKLGGIQGEVSLKGFEEFIEVLSWNWSMEQPRLIARPNRASGARAEFHGLEFEHELDNASPKLMFAVANKTVYPDASLQVLALPEEGVENKPYLIASLKDVRVAQVEIAADSGSRPVETFTLNFEAAKMEYWLQKEDGSREKGSEFMWNVRTNRAEF